MPRKHKFPYDYRTIPLQNVNGSATFIGSPSRDMIDLVTKVAELAYKTIRKQNSRRMSIFETIKVYDEKGFVYEVQLKHEPNFGFATAYYKDSPIAQAELGRIRKPFSDNDAEWERYEESLSDWKCEIKTNIIPQCQQYFNDRN